MRKALPLPTAPGKNLAENISLYISGTTSFIPGLLPQEALVFSPAQTLEILRRRYGSPVDAATAVLPDQPASTTGSMQEIHSPVAGQTGPDWLKTANIAGINLRTVKSFWGVINYALTLPAAQSAIHLLPFWEPGVVGSLYGICSWQLNREFFSQELVEVLPQLNSSERQLKAVVNLLHLMGKTAGMDVVPHTDRFSEIVLLNPDFFEWVRRKGTRILDQSENLHQPVQSHILTFLEQAGPAVANLPAAPPANRFFTADTPESTRGLQLFGRPEDFAGRLQRRIALIRHLHSAGFETVPATMAPPYRGLRIDGSDTARKVDENGLEWRDYLINNPQPMSRVFGPLTRYKLYGRKNDNAEWEIDFAKPRPQVWQYICARYAAFQSDYGFDFMRGDMSHVQMRETGVPANPDNYYDLHRAVKDYIQTRNNAPYFAYFAESFLAPPNVMGYGDEADHLEASRTDIALGDLQSEVVGSDQFLQVFHAYRQHKLRRSFTPCLTVMTADKDDPRFDHFYHSGNALRLFISLFISDMPGYMAAGFETRDVHLSPAPNEHYSKLYVFQEKTGPKATTGPFVWGENRELFASITRIRLFFEGVAAGITGRPLHWLNAPHPHRKVLVWRYRGPEPALIFVANSDLQNRATVAGLRIPGSAGKNRLELLFSTAGELPAPGAAISADHNRSFTIILAPGEGQVYRLNPPETR